MNKRVDPKLLSAALSTPEEGVAPPGRAQATSAITQIATLKVGDHWSTVYTPPGNTPLKDFAAESGELRASLRSRVQSSVRHAQAKTGGQYTVETGDFIATNRTIYLVCVVTRIG